MATASRLFCPFYFTSVIFFTVEFAILKCRKVFPWLPFSHCVVHTFPLISTPTMATITWLLDDSSPWVSLISACLASHVLSALVLGCPFSICIANSLRGEGVSLWSQVQICLLLIVKDFGSLTSEPLS